MPWNFPLWQVIRASAPIMLSGNGFLLKHAPNVMGSAYALQAAYEAAGFPKGLFVNLVADNDTVARTIADPRIAAVTLTGSMRAGSAVAATAGKALKKSSAGTGWRRCLHRPSRRQYRSGGQSRRIDARFQNAGQVCLAAKRFILEQPIAAEFTEKFIAAAQTDQGRRSTRPSQHHWSDGTRRPAR
jgi:succinate-semialdehyde dehydrogenase